MSIVIKNANVFNGVDEQLLKNVDLLIENNLITQIGKVDDSNAEQIIYAEGKTVMPGLIDAHVHITLSAGFNELDGMTREEIAIRSARISEEMLMRGFTTIRDVAGNTLGLKNSIVKVMRKVQEFCLVWPRFRKLVVTQTTVKTKHKNA